MAEVMHYLDPQHTSLREVNGKLSVRPRIGGGSIFTACGVLLWDPDEPITRDTSKVKSTNVLASVTCEACKVTVVTDALTTR